MDCNKDDALKAKEIAEKKFLANDINGAKKFALKAQSLYPSLENINQMLATLDVHLCSIANVGEEKDWYAILGISQSTDEETLKKQYRKLALQLHPDKNKSVGAESAFQFISQAWSVLSDKSKRMIYDHKRFGRASIPKSTTATAAATAMKNNTSFPDTTDGSQNNAASKVHSQKSNVSGNSNEATFWTSCNTCKIQYEYQRAYLNLNLICPSCKKAFLASETIKTKKKPPISRQWGPFSRTAGAASASASTTAAAQAANVVHQTYEKVRREREEAQAAARREEIIRRSSNASSKFEKQTKRQRGNNAADSKLNNGGGDAGNPTKLSTFSRKLSVRNGYPHSHVLTTLLCKSRDELHRMVDAISSARATKMAGKEASKRKQRMKDPLYEKLEPSSTCEQILHSKNIVDLEDKSSEPMGIDVPDPDFHDFDNDRSERSFNCDDVWATYDDEDGMPRYYAIIQKALSYTPFKVKMSFLASSKSMAEFGPSNWLSFGFAKTNGEFRIVRYEVKDTINIFSHKVSYEKGLRGTIKIIPKKGQIWALYRNWSPDWNEQTPDDLIYKYDMVEILDDYNDELGLPVAPLVKIVGFKTIFRTHADPEKRRKIPKDEMFRLSHQVPSYVLTGEEGNGAPKGCYELDPAATPVELLRVYNEPVSDEVMHAPQLSKQEPAHT